MQTIGNVMEIEQEGKLMRIAELGIWSDLRQYYWLRGWLASCVGCGIYCIE